MALEPVRRIGIGFLIGLIPGLFLAYGAPMGKIGFPLGWWTAPILMLTLLPYPYFVVRSGMMPDLEEMSEPIAGLIPRMWTPQTQLGYGLSIGTWLVFLILRHGSPDSFMAAGFSWGGGQVYTALLIGIHSWQTRRSGPT